MFELDIFNPGFDARERQRIWGPFLDEAERLARMALPPDADDPDGKLFDRAMIRAQRRLLRKYGGTTDWDDEESPLLFRTREQLVHFMMVWG